MAVPLPWTANKALIGVVHLGHLPGQPGYAGLDGLLAAARDDARALEAGGAHALLVENWKDASPGPFVGPEAVAAMTAVVRALVAETALPVGVNVLPNDYRAAFALVAVGARFVQLDVFSDRVRTDYSYSDAPPFDVEVDLDDVARWRARLGAEGVALLATVHPKHYALLEPALTLEASARAALAAGADAVVVTGAATGSAPDPARVRRVREALGPAARVIVGSGVTEENARDLLAPTDGAIVGTALRTPDFARVLPERVRALARAFADVERGSP